MTDKNRIARHGESTWPYIEVGLNQATEAGISFANWPASSWPVLLSVVMF